eukprot:382516-Prymnesium_polylepis.1
MRDVVGLLDACCIRSAEHVHVAAIKGPWQGASRRHSVEPSPLRSIGRWAAAAVEPYHRRRYFVDRLATDDSIPFGAK